MKPSNVLTAAEALSRSKTSLVRLVSACLVLAVLVMLSGCGKSSDLPVDPLANQAGGIPPAVCTTPDCALIPPPGGGTNPSGQVMSGTIYVVPSYAPYETFVLLQNTSYYVGSQTSSQVRALLQQVQPGVYQIYLRGTLGAEAGHKPQLQSQYPVVHIQETLSAPSAY